MSTQEAHSHPLFEPKSEQPVREATSARSEGSEKTVSEEGNQLDASEPVNDVFAVQNESYDIPNGGWVAWSQVAGSFFLFFNSW